MIPDWLLGPLAVVGVVAIATGFITLFFALGRRPGRIWLERAPRLGSPEFFGALAGTVGSGVRRGGTATLLDNGDAFYPRMLDAIRGAQHTINFTCYIWETGRIGDAFFDALLERIYAGVEVRVLFDGMGGLRAPRERITELEQAGASVAWFRPLRFGKLLRFHKRNHRRAIIIDGNIGFTGGAAIGDKWCGNAQDPRHWRDSMVEVTGPPATALQYAFASMWAYAGQELLVGEGHFPRHAPPAGEPDHEVTSHVHIASSPSSESHPLRVLFLLSFFCARERLYIASPYFAPDRFLREVLRARARAGVDVRILLPNHLTDAKPIRFAARSYYDELLREGVRIYEYQPTFMHNKIMVADGLWAIVGSANMDVRSKELNQENVLGICDRGFGSAVEASFLRDLEASVEFDLEGWRRRPLLARIPERVCVMFAEQF